MRVSIDQNVTIIHPDNSISSVEMDLVGRFYDGSSEPLNDGSCSSIDLFEEGEGGVFLDSHQDPPEYVQCVCRSSRSDWLALCPTRNEFSQCFRAVFFFSGREPLMEGDEGNQSFTVEELLGDGAADTGDTTGLLGSLKGRINRMMQQGDDDDTHHILQQLSESELSEGMSQATQESSRNLATGFFMPERSTS
jgi:hypothetical protein